MVAGRSSPEETDYYVFTSRSYGRADRRRKIGVLTVPVACRRPNFSPVRAAFLSLWPAAEPSFILSGPVDASDFKGVTALKRTIRKFLNIVAAHTEGIGIPQYVYLKHFFSCQCPFNKFWILIKGSAIFPKTIS
jgi:hypothetical protein